MTSVFTKVTSHISVPESWHNLIHSISKGDRVMVVGPVDSGKTSFCMALINEKKKEGIKNIAYFDFDPGQQNIFIPSCVSATLGRKNFYFFVGKLSPNGAEHMMILALLSLTKRVSPYRPSISLLDTSGYVNGDRALLLKLAKAYIFKPTKIVIIDIGGDMSRFEKLFSFLCRKIYVIEPSDKARKISQEERSEIRRKRFEEYFSKAHDILIDSSNVIELFYPQMPETSNLTKLIGFFRENITLCVGIVRGIDMGKLLVSVPHNIKKWDFALTSYVRTNMEGEVKHGW